MKVHTGMMDQERLYEARARRVNIRSRREGIGGLISINLPHVGEAWRISKDCGGMGNGEPNQAIWDQGSGWEKYQLSR